MSASDKAAETLADFVYEYEKTQAGIRGQCSSRALEFNGLIMECMRHVGHGGLHTDGCVGWSDETAIGAPPQLSPCCRERQEEIETLRRRLQLSEQEVERWRHGVTIEGDFICPDSLDLTEAERVIDVVRESLEWIEGSGKSDILNALHHYDRRKDVP